MSNDDDWCEAVEAAGERTGERVGGCRSTPSTPT